MPILGTLEGTLTAGHGEQSLTVHMHDDRVQDIIAVSTVPCGVNKYAISQLEYTCYTNSVHAMHLFKSACVNVCDEEALTPTSACHDTRWQIPVMPLTFFTLDHAEWYVYD